MDNLLHNLLEFWCKHKQADIIWSREEWDYDLTFSLTMRQFNEMLTLVQDNGVVNSAHDDMSLNTCNPCINILTAKISVLRRNFKLNIFANEMQKVENTIEKKLFDIIQLSISTFQMKESAKGQGVHRIQIVGLSRPLLPTIRKQS